MPEGHSEDPFDLEQLQHVLEMMEKHGLTELSLRNGTVHWRLRRGHPEAQVVAYAPPPMAPAFAPASPAPKGAVNAEKPASAADEGLIEIKSPTVGTFYASPSPEEPSFVSVGAKVTPKTIVCLIEAMKVFNQIPADTTGTITAVLVKNGDAVEFGQPLFKVRP